MRTAFGKIKTRLAAGVGSTVAVGAAAVYSVFGAGPPPPVAQYGAGSAIEAGRWRVTPQRAWVSHKRVYGVPIKPGQQALVLEADLSNRTRTSTGSYSDLLRLQPVPGAKPEDPVVAQVRDPQIAPLLHPGMPERVVYVWMMPGSATPPASLSVDVVAETYKPVDNLFGTPGWFNPAVIGRVTLPLGQPPAGAEQAS
ncbi:hypothetical protein [Bordetella petrii]|uniref:hypothetical protein n=1 Tax=Bordetella petrii TaxID=94624 RepID=UPI001A9687EF|nr:hypothetical protein [Bordetella petrii]MBO1110346.1 hypothetical protein [Bordetella petrii]